MYICYVVCLKPLIPAAYGGRYRSTHAFTLCYVLCLYVRISSYRCMLSYYTIVAYALCDMLLLFYYAYGTIL